LDGRPERTLERTFYTPPGNRRQGKAQVRDQAVEMLLAVRLRVGQPGPVARRESRRSTAVTPQHSLL